MDPQDAVLDGLRVSLGDSGEEPDAEPARPQPLSERIDPSDQQATMRAMKERMEEMQGELLRMQKLMEAQAQRAEMSSARLSEALSHPILPDDALPVAVEQESEGEVDAVVVPEGEAEEEGEGEAAAAARPRQGGTPAPLLVRPLSGWRLHAARKLMIFKDVFNMIRGRPVDCYELRDVEVRIEADKEVIALIQCQERIRRKKAREQELRRFWEQLQYREITAADYQMLVAFDELIEKPTLSAEEFVEMTKEMTFNQEEDGEVVDPTGVSPMYQRDEDDHVVCTVCLEECQDGEKLLLIEVCRHCFHPDCIRSWLLSHSRFCPVCRAGVA